MNVFDFQTFIILTSLVFVIFFRLFTSHLVFIPNYTAIVCA